MMVLSPHVRPSNINYSQQSVDKGRVAEHFSAAATHYDQYAQVQKDIALENLNLLERFTGHQLGNQAGNNAGNNAQQALDLGCGTGLHTESLATLAHRCLAVDISHRMLNTARERHEQSINAKIRNIRYCNADADNLPVASGTIDLLHSSMALQWCRSPTNAINEIARVLSAKGTAQLAIMLDSSLVELKQAWLNLGITPRVNQFFSQQEWLEATQALCAKHNVRDADVSINLPIGMSINVQHEVRCFTEWHAGSLHMLRALKRIGAATKSSVHSAGNMENEVMFHNRAQAMSKSELMNLDAHMSKQMQRHDKGNCQQVNMLPLSYHILFITIQKQENIVGE